mgnify:CR=1 FL=1
MYDSVKRLEPTFSVGAYANAAAALTNATRPATACRRVFIGAEFALVFLARAALRRSRIQRVRKLGRVLSGVGFYNPRPSPGCFYHM